MGSPQPVIINSEHNKIERFGLEAVPKELRNTSWIEYFIIQVAFSVNSGNFIVPALAVIQGNLSFLAAVLSTIVGAGVAFLFVSFLSLPGAKNGIPAQFAMRSVLGIELSRFFASPVRIVTSLYWFAVQTIGGTLVLIELFKLTFQIELPFSAVALSLGIVMSVLALIGFEAVKKATKLFLPVLLFGQIIMLYIFVTSRSSTGFSFTTITEQGTWNVGTMLFFASLAFVQYVSGVSASSDVTRYAKSHKHAFWGLYTGNMAGFMMTAVLGAYTAIIANSMNPFITASQITNSYLFIFVIFCCAMVSMLSINLSNAYTGGYSLLNSLPQLGRVKSAVLFGIVATVLCTLPSLVNEAKQYISFLGALIIPLSAIIVSDFIFLKKLELTLSDLDRLLDNSFKYNKSGLLCIAFGMILYLLLPENWSPGFISFILTIVLYLSFSGIKKNTEPLEHDTVPFQ